jgi:mannose-6-phosphate isomerase-like protein (cupin superfamily)
MKTVVFLVSLAFGLIQSAHAAQSAVPADPPTDAVLIDHTKVDLAAAKGLPLLINSSYKIQWGRRVAPGAVEIHEHDTDILYVTDGTATFITGGTATEVTVTKPGEKTGKEITGGVTHHLVKGDIIVIPSGVPHWFSEVNAPFVYFVVKVTK